MQKRAIFFTAFLCLQATLTHGKMETNCGGAGIQLPKNYLSTLRTRKLGQPDFATKIKTSPFWKTQALFRAAWVGEGSFFPNVAKVWELSKDQNSLAELTKSSVIKEAQGPVWASKTVDLSQGFRDSDYLDIIATETSKYLFKDLKEGRFAMISDAAIILFSPQQARSELVKSDAMNFNHWNAPLGIFVETAKFLSDYPRPAPLPTAPLRHNLAQAREVSIDQSFPRQYHEAVAMAVREWNASLGTEFYKIVSAGEALDPLECLAKDSGVCVFWTGPEKLTWANFVAIAGFGFDPFKAEIQGGVITFNNHADANEIVETPEQIKQMYFKNEITPQNAATFLMKREEFRKYAHPEPNLLISSVLVHEMGHDFGMPHYFAGSLTGTVDRPTDTIMDYVPFPLFHKTPRPQVRDLSKLSALYKNGIFVSEPACTDFEVMFNPVCQPGDMGEPVMWNFMLAVSGNDWVFSDLPTAGGLNFGSVSKVIDRLGLFLKPNTVTTTGQADLVRQVLCQKPERLEEVQKYLREKMQVELTCANVPLAQR